jgi:hypothetical protein
VRGAALWLRDFRLMYVQAMQGGNDDENNASPFPMMICDLDGNRMFFI